MTDVNTTNGVLRALCAADSTLPDWLRAVQSGELVVESQSWVSSAKDLASHFQGMTQGWVCCQSHTRRYTSNFTLAEHAETLLQAEACDGGSVSVHVSNERGGWRVCRIRRVSSEAALLSTSLWLARTAAVAHTDEQHESTADAARYAAYEICWRLVEEPGLPTKVWREQLGRFAGWREKNHA